VKIIADENIPFVEDCFSSVGQVITRHGREITGAVVKDADVLLVRSITEVNGNLLAGSKIRFVGTATIGFEHIDTDYLARYNIGFASAPGSNANSVAEYVIAALLTLATKYNFCLQGKSIGVVGAGYVGSRVSKKCAALCMKVLLNDPPLYRQTGDAKYLPLEKLFGCDFITLHTPLTFEGIDKTFHLAGERFFNSLRDGCIFLNTARGAVTDSDALKQALESGRLRGAVLDVWENEPNIDIELLKMVDIATAHIAGYSFDGKVAGMIMIYKAMCEYFGMEAKYTGSDFPGPAAVEKIGIDTSCGGEQERLLESVEKVYDIKEDDLKLRQVSDVLAKGRGRFFDDLRRNYPTRREFCNTQVVVRDRASSLASKLEGIGFLLAQE